MATQESRPASGIAMALIGVWLVLQSVGGNLASRIRPPSGIGKSGTTASDDIARSELGVMAQRLSRRDGISFSAALDQLRSEGLLK